MDGEMCAPVLVEQEGALLNGHILGLHKEEIHKGGHADHTNAA